MTKIRISFTFGVLVLFICISSMNPVAAQESTVCVSQYGAKGDGVTDDTAAINAAFLSGATNVVFENKVYKCSDALYLYHDINIYGNQATILVSDYQPTGSGVYSFFRYGTKNVDGKKIYMENLTIHITDVDYQYQSRHLNIVDFAGIYKESVHFKNVNIYQDESITMRHVFTGYSKEITLEGCNFYNLSTGDKGGAFWIAARNGAVNKTVISNCTFKNAASDEVFAVYGSDTKNVLVNNSKFIFDSSHLKKNTIFMSFYEGPSSVEFNSCTFEQYGETLDNPYLIKGIARVQNYESTVGTIVSFKQCDFNCDTYSSVFAQINFSNDKAWIYADNCNITAENAPLNGNFHCYQEDGYDKIAIFPTPIVVTNSKINVAYSLCEQPNGDEAPFYSCFNNCEITISKARSVLYTEYSRNLSRVVNRCFSISDSKITTDIDVPIERYWHSNTTKINSAYTNGIAAENSYLNGKRMEG